MTISVPDLYRQAEELKNNVSAKSYTNSLDDIYNLRQFYKTILLSDLDYALDHKIEQDLWNICFKNYINTIQPGSKNIADSGSSDGQTLLSWFLESSAGFFLGLIEEFSLTISEKPLCMIKQSIKCPNQTSSQYFLQYCFLHLGDLMRYRNSSSEAEKYYRHALQLSPSNGQPYNQLALLEAARGDKLSTIYYYVRSLAVRHPFPPASANLQKLYSKYISSYYDLDSKSRLALPDFVLLVLKVHGHLHLMEDLGKVEGLMRLFQATLGSLLATEKLSKSHLIKFVAITLFSLQQNIEIKGKGEYYSPERKRCEEYLIQLLSIMLTCFVSSSYMIPSLKWNFAPLPAVKLILDWLFLHDNILFNAFFNHSQLWLAFAKFMNELQSLIEETVGELRDSETEPLDEDQELREFSPLRKVMSKLDKEQSVVLTTHCDTIRVLRILKRAEWLTTKERDGVRLLTCNRTEGNIVFDAVNQPDLADEIAAVEIGNSGGLKKGILKVRAESEKLNAGRRSRNVALTSIMRRTEETNKDANIPVSEPQDLNRQVSFKDGSEPLESPTAKASADSINTRHGGYQRSVLPPRLERLRTEQREKDNILASLGLFSGFGTSVCSVPPPLVDFTRPPPPLQPPPGLWDPRPSLPTSTPWTTSLPGSNPATVLPVPSFSLFDTSNSLQGLGTGLARGQLNYSSMNSMWKDSGPSPLERLLEQQRVSRQAQKPSGYNN